MENQNQNKLNATQDMLNQIKNEKKANQNVLAQIQSAQTDLAKKRQVFETYKQEQNGIIDEARKALNQESSNHAKLDTVQMQATIDDLNSQVAGLTKQNSDLTKQVADLNKKIKDAAAA